MTTEEFARRSLFGCAACYEAFDEDLDLLLKRLHGAVAHRGRLPQRGPTRREGEPGSLRRELDRAVRDGDFERAARLRDRLRDAERGGPRRGREPGEAT